MKCDFCLTQNQTKMKKKLLKVSSCILITGSVLFASGNALAEGNSARDSILIGVKETTPQGSPRMPAYIPFYAEQINVSVLLGSYSYYGVVDVTLTSTAGDDYSTVFDTADGTIIIPISGSQGDYTLLITTASGLEFTGEFVL